MYIVKNALQNLVRNRGRNLMIGGIIFVIIVSVVTALMINNTANGVITDYKTRFGSEVNISPNMQRVQEEAMKNNTGDNLIIRQPKISSEDLIKFGESDYLQSSIYTATTKGNSDQLNPIDKEKGTGGGPSLSSKTEGGDLITEQVGRNYYHKIMAGDYMDFENGLRELTTDSSYPKNRDECIISKELLESSGLKIGDTITVTSALEEVGDTPENSNYTDIEWKMTIVGTYTDITDEYSAGMMENAYANRRNEILTTFETLSEKIVDGLFGIEVAAKYYLKNPDLLDAFTAEVKEKGLESVFDVTTDSSSYSKVVGPVEGLKNISVTFVIIVLAFGAIILALLSSIAIRERKYEIGVLRAMGMKKSKILAGLWCETLVITTICLIIGLGVGGLAAQPVTNMMLEQQVAAAEEAANNNNILSPGASLTQIGGNPDESNTQPLKNLDISLELMTIIEIVGIALLLSSLSGIITTRKIVKYEPIKILMERN
ncbi:FtsX-like permease family protein [Enterococcus sp. BWB1-3]|uniref:ABC transporter permease n=1 Tax=unclassified Enterococcus TaxID=2608891 RepID=UPI001924B97B|nr:MULTISPECIES: FtsX-like permease family protein [unclassified Enterococcus]MBL1230589.1 FtsX-like permease family protein [Enterococcus sp. BWB1-3]MCB5955530.1 FtsX-like permease family protein [Enterococcus sp. CWB-B31]